MSQKVIGIFHRIQIIISIIINISIAEDIGRWKATGPCGQFHISENFLKISLVSTLTVIICMQHCSCCEPERWKKSRFQLQIIHFARVFKKKKNYTAAWTQFPFLWILNFSSSKLNSKSISMSACAPRCLSSNFRISLCSFFHSSSLPLINDIFCLFYFHPIPTITENKPFNICSETVCFLTMIIIIPRATTTIVTNKFSPLS